MQASRLGTEPDYDKGGRPSRGGVDRNACWGDGPSSTLCSGRPLAWGRGSKRERYASPCDKAGCRPSRGGVDRNWLIAYYLACPRLISRPSRGGVDRNAICRAASVRRAELARRPSRGGVDRNHLARNPRNPMVRTTVAPRVGAWIETSSRRLGFCHNLRQRSPLAWGRGSKRYNTAHRVTRECRCRPSRGGVDRNLALRRGHRTGHFGASGQGRPSRGGVDRNALLRAESGDRAQRTRSPLAWGRGSKPIDAVVRMTTRIYVAPRVGAWIETVVAPWKPAVGDRCRRPSRGGVDRNARFTESIGHGEPRLVAPRVGAWIETL